MTRWIPIASTMLGRGIGVRRTGDRPLKDGRK
jgi:hypothetical protein